MPATSILLIRHCESTGQAPEARLTDEGAVAALALRDVLGSLEVDAVYSSPFRRALETIGPYASSRSLTVQVDHRLAERRLSASPLADWLNHIRLSFADFDYRAPGGETMREAQDRALAALADIASAGHRSPAVATHGNLLSGLLRCVDAAFGFGDWQSLRNPEIFRMRFEGGKPVGYERLEISLGTGRRNGVPR